MKRVLGLDLGTNSIGWAYVLEAENETEQSSIVKLGVRIGNIDNLSVVKSNGTVSESKDPLKDFASGKTISFNAKRTQKRHARRNLDRFQLRRDNLIKEFVKNGWITKEHSLNEDGFETHNTYRIRAKSAVEKVSLIELAKILLTINKKRGYKSSRKAQNEDESGQLINEIDIALKLREDRITPGEYSLSLLKNEKKQLPSYYKSDLVNEFDGIWEMQKKEFPEILTEEFKRQILGKSKIATSKIFYAKYKIHTSQNKATDKKIQAYEWRVKASKEICDEEVMAFAIAEINGSIANSSGYLGAIGDRSKILHLKNLTVGQLQYQQILANPHTSATTFPILLFALNFMSCNFR